ncbi:MAG: hypothetical protein ACYCU0_12355, partial [Solirubrobacteraceae bacterium]
MSSVIATDEAPLRFGSSERLGGSELADVRVRVPRPSRLALELGVPSERVKGALASLGIETVGDLLAHLPRRMRASRTIETLRIGEQATIAVEVQRISRRTARRRVRGRPLTLVEATVSDGTGSIGATFFNQPWLLERYQPGTKLMLHGALRGRRGFAVSHHALAPHVATPQEPSPSLPDGEEGDAPTRQRAAVAHYTATDGVSSTQILALVERHRDALAHVIEPLPPRLLAAQRLPDRASALTAMHFPADEEDLE